MDDAAITAIKNAQAAIADLANANDNVIFRDGTRNKLARCRATGMWEAEFILREQCAAMGIVLEAPKPLHRRPLELDTEDRPSR